MAPEHTTSTLGLEPTVNDAAQRKPLETAHRVRTDQWMFIAPEVRSNPVGLLYAAADVEAVLRLIGEVAGILAKDEGDRDYAPQERDVVLKDLTRHHLCAGLEAVADLAATALASVQSHASDRLREAQRRGGRREG